MPIEALPSELDIFEHPVIQTGIIDGDWVQFRPLTPLSDNTPISFFIPGQGEKYVDVSRTLLNIQVKIT